MTQPSPMTEIWRGPFLESVHTGHAVVCDSSGEIVEAWGDPDKIVLPRSSCKMIQALPLITSGAADAAGLTTEHLALACASHAGEQRHVDTVSAWLGDLGLDETGVTGADGALVLSWNPAGLPAWVTDKFPHLSGYSAFTLDPADLYLIPMVLKGQTAVSASAGDDSTGSGAGGGSGSGGTPASENTSQRAKACWCTQSPCMPRRAGKACGRCSV